MFKVQKQHHFIKTKLCQKFKSKIILLKQNHVKSLKAKSYKKFKKKNHFKIRKNM